MRFIIRTFILNAQKYFFRLIYKLKPMIIKVPVSNDYQNRFPYTAFSNTDFY